MAVSTVWKSMYPKFWPNMVTLTIGPEYVVSYQLSPATYQYNVPGFVFALQLFNSWGGGGETKLIMRKKLHTSVMSLFTPQHVGWVTGLLTFHVCIILFHKLLYGGTVFILTVAKRSTVSLYTHWNNAVAKFLYLAVYRSVLLKINHSQVLCTV